jgi:pre-mRNA-splicing factor SYF1
MYLTHLMKQCKITHTRRTFDGALRALPLTQHDRIWKLYLEFARSASGATAVRIWKRYMQVQPELREDFIDLLLELNAYSEAARQYIIVLNDATFKSRQGKSNYQLWSEFADLLVSHPQYIDTDIPVERILRAGIERFSDQRGKLWTSLATYWITLQDFERARDSFEEGLTTVMTVRDFTQIFDAYAEFEESIISEKMEEASQRQSVDAAADLDLDIRMMRFEQLMDRRAFLVNDVLLRQNQNNVVEWEKRVALWGVNKNQVVATYTDAIKTINPKKASGRFSHLWVSFAKFYEEGGDLKTAREIMEKATRVGYRSVNELADVWIDFAEMEIRGDNVDKALEIMALATKAPRVSNVDYFDDVRASNNLLTPDFDPASASPQIEQVVVILRRPRRKLRHGRLCQKDL